MELEITVKDYATIIQLNDIVSFEIQMSNILVIVEHIWFAFEDDTFLNEKYLFEINCVLAQINALYDNKEKLMNDIAMFARKEIKANKRKENKDIKRAQVLARLIYETLYNTPTKQASGNI